MAFGYGAHFCLGAALARVEMRALLEVLLERFDELAPAVAPDQLDWQPTIDFRGPLSLPVVTAPASTPAPVLAPPPGRP